MSDKFNKMWIYLNFSILYIVWGMTYIWMKQAVGTLHPFKVIFWQNFLAGIFIFSILKFKGILGFIKSYILEILTQSLLMLILGVGLITISVAKVPASFAAIVISSVPLWVCFFEFLKRKNLERTKLMGISFGFVGLVYLVYTGQEQKIPIQYSVLLLFAAASWSYGLHRMNYLESSINPLMSSASQMIFASVFYFFAAIYFSNKNFIPNNLTGIYSILALSILGSTIAYSSLLWLLKNVAPVKVSTYAYINPIVSMIMATTLLREQLTFKQITASSFILLSVFLVVSDLDKFSAKVLNRR